MTRMVCHSFADFPALIVSGGHETPKKVSVYSLSGGWEVSSCSIPKLPKNRYQHTMDLNIICGGGGGTDSMTSCIKMTTAGWVTSHELLYKRFSHSSWVVDDGIILMGGQHAGKRTEIAKWDGTTEELFALENYIE